MFLHNIFVLFVFFTFHSNFQIKLLDLSHVNMFQPLEECTATAALSCRIQKWQEVICKFLCFVLRCGFLFGLVSSWFTPNRRYSMVLIGAAFFHHRYLQLFQDQPQAVHALVDETQNCDDIAVNFAVALYLREHSKVSAVYRPAGIFVKPVDLRNLEKDAKSGYQGMWHRPEHLLQRSYCLNRLTQIYGLMPLRYSNLMVSQFGFPSYANHKSRGWKIPILLFSGKMRGSL